MKIKAGNAYESQCPEENEKRPRMIAKEVYRKQLTIITPILAQLELDFIRYATEMDTAMDKATKWINRVPTVDVTD